MELERRTKTKILEKKPSKGGTPASERMAILITFVKKFEGPSKAKAYNVLKLVFINCNIEEKSRKEVKL